MRKLKSWEKRKHYTEGVNVLGAFLVALARMGVFSPEIEAQVGLTCRMMETYDSQYSGKVDIYSDEELALGV